MPIQNLPDGLTLMPRPLWQFIYRPRAFYARLRSRFGDLARIRVPHAALFMTMSPEGARDILAGHPDNYEAFQKEAFHGVFGDGSMFIMEGAQHHRERSALMPLFQRWYVPRYAARIQEIIRSHEQEWRPGQQLRAEKAMLAISRDVILFVVFGSDFERLREEGHRLLKAELEGEGASFLFIPQLQVWWWSPWIKHRLIKRRLMAFLSRALAERRASGREENDLLGRLIAFRDEKGDPKSDDEIVDQLFSILLPGHATTGVAISWALYELARHPDVLQRLRAELDGLGPEPDPVQLAKLPYLDAVCKESMRLHTIVTETARKIRKPQSLLGFTLPAGCGLGVGIHAIHHHSRLYPNPSQFRPERFADRPYGPFEFLPFGGGHRRCMGAALSDFEMRLTVATLVSKWNFESLREEEEVRHDLGVGAKFGVPVRISRRAATAAGVDLLLPVRPPSSS